jgi:Beta-lactamase enzyme family
VRVGDLLRLLLWAVAIVAVSAAAAVWLLDTGSSSSGQAHSTAPISVRPAPTAGAARNGEKPAPVPSSTGTTGRSAPSMFRSGAAASWESMARSVPARLGLAVAPLGVGGDDLFGELRTGHAWSTIKVSIVSALLHDRGGRPLNPEEEAWAREALTASDNDAGAALFRRLEEAHSGLSGASLAVQETLRRAGDDSTVVATAPPPPGAVSTYGQTEWSLRGSVEFFRALGQGCLLDRADTDYVLGLMGEVVPEQRWGLSEADFPPSWRVALKGGWGPEGSASGPYLVRQSGIISDGDAGVAVAMIARADSGSFEAGVEALDRVAAWLAGNLRGLGPSATGGC